MRSTKIAALFAAAALMLVACGAAVTEGPREGSGVTPNTIMVFEVETTTTGLVECIYAEDGYSGGLSCNW